MANCRRPGGVLVDMGGPCHTRQSVNSVHVVPLAVSPTSDRPPPTEVGRRRVGRELRSQRIGAWVLAPNECVDAAHQVVVSRPGGAVLTAQRANILPQST